MNLEFHYYAVYILALEAGFSENSAFVIAASSQELDASTSELGFDTGQKILDIVVSQNYSFWNDAVKNDIYLPFHFIPGNAEEARNTRKDGKNCRFLVTPNSESVKSLLIDALKDKDPYLIGVAAHSFADSYAHQNFSGLEEEANSLGGFSGNTEESPGKSLFRDLAASGLPPVGHLQALSAPDEPGLVWTDLRLKEEKVVNNKRFAIAAKKLFRYLRIYLGKSFGDEELITDKLNFIWEKPSKEERISDYIIGWNLRPYEPQLWRREAGAPFNASKLAGLGNYDKLAWAKKELFNSGKNENGSIIKTDASFYSSNLYHWNEAAAEHRRRAKLLIERHHAHE